MAFTAAQIRGKIKSIAEKNGADPRILLRIYMMDRFLERLALSPYRDNFIIKGGILVTSMVGVSMRSTMDIDATVRSLNLNAEEIRRTITEITGVPMNDGINFEVRRVTSIMDNFEYPGIRLELDALMEGMVTPVKIDISTGDVITPEKVEYSYHLLLENRNINLWAYNLETILSEKLQTILERNVFNTRMRDFYDVYALTMLYGNNIDVKIFSEAFKSTSMKRKSTFADVEYLLKTISESHELKILWEKYKGKYVYAADISFENVICSVKALARKAGLMT